MAQHFLISPEARSLSIAQVLRLSDTEAFETFKRLRFAANAGEPFCPHCGTLKVYTLNEAPIRWKCAECRRKFSVTSGTLFHSRKLAIRDYLAVVFLFVNGVKGVAALHMARDMNINPKSAFVLLHKLREAMAAVVNGAGELSGIVEIDGMYTHKYFRQPNRKAERVDLRTVEDRKQVVVVARERGLGRSRTWVVAKEGDAVPMIRQAVANGTEVHADESDQWNILHASFPMKRVNHSAEFKSEDGGCTNEAESFFSRLRRSEYGIHHRISGSLLHTYATECAWREDHRRVANGTQWNLITAAALHNRKSERWAGYWHRENVA